MAWLVATALTVTVLVAATALLTAAATAPDSWRVVFGSDQGSEPAVARRFRRGREAVVAQVELLVEPVLVEAGVKEAARKFPKKIAVGLGRFGMFARGVTFLVIGWFLIQAGLHNDAGQAHGFGGAFLFLLAQPYGHVLVGVIALGFVALGLHSFACARWIRLMGNQGTTAEGRQMGDGLAR